MADDRRISDRDIEKLRKSIGITYEYHEDTARSPAPRAAPQAAQLPEMPEPEEFPSAMLRQSPIQAQPSDSSPDRTLFVKIDNHLEVAQDIFDAKKDVQAIAGTVSLLAKAEQLKAEAIEKMESSLNLLSAKLDDIDRQLVTPDNLAMPEMGMEVSGPARDASGNLKSELASLRNELSKL